MWSSDTLELAEFVTPARTIGCPFIMTPDHPVTTLPHMDFGESQKIRWQSLKLSVKNVLDDKRRTHNVRDDVEKVRKAWDDMEKVREAPQEGQC